MLIGTHNSATGEASKGLLSYLVIPFARTQSKTLKEQCEAGCRYFDLRVKYIKSTLYFAHGLWTSKTTLEEGLSTLNKYIGIYAHIAYEGSLKDEDIPKFISDVEQLMCKYDNIEYIYIAVKKPTWRTLKSINPIQSIDRYVVLDGRSWHTYIPIPWLWDKLTHHVYTEDGVYNIVDFL